MLVANPKVVDMTSLLTADIVSESGSKEEFYTRMIQLINSVNRIQLYGIYALGKAWSSENKLKDKFSVTFEQIAESFKISRNTVWTYRKFAETYTANEVVILSQRSVSLTAALIVPKLLNLGQKDMADSLKEALLDGNLTNMKDATNIYNEVKRALAIDNVLPSAELSQACLLSLEDGGDDTTVIDPEIESDEPADENEEKDSCGDGGADESDVKDSVKAAKKATAKSLTSLDRLNALINQLVDDAPSLFDIATGDEDEIIADDESHNKYVDAMLQTGINIRQLKETLCEIEKELVRRGIIKEKIVEN